MTKKEIMASVAAIGIIGATGLFGIQAVSAHGSESSGSSLVEKIATRFNLNQEEVQSVFDEHRQQMHADHQQQLEGRLQQAVDSGQITSEQKDMLVAKLEEIHEQHQANRESLQDMTADERHEAMEQQRDELEQWAEENGISLDLLHQGFGGQGYHGSQGMHGMMGM